MPAMAGETTIMISGAPSAAEFFGDDGEFVNAGAAAAVLRGQVDAEEPGRADGLP